MPTVVERLGILETKFDTVVVPMAENVKDIRTVLKDNGLCAQVKSNTENIYALRGDAVASKDRLAEIEKTVALDSGEERRKTWLSRQPTWKKVSAVGGIIVLLLRPEIKELLELAFKWYFNIE